MEDFASALNLVLDQEILLAEELLALLREENTALTTLDDSRIMLNSQRKEQLIENLQQVTSQRSALMVKHKISREMVHRSEELEMKFSRLDDITTRCVEENRLIGQLIHRRSSMIKDLLGKMTGTLPASDITYGSDGQAEHYSNSRNHIAL